MKSNFHHFPLNVVQWLSFFAAFAVSIFLLVAERGGDSLPCLAAEGKSHSPCGEMKANVNARLGFSPALPGSIGTALCVLVATFRMGARHGSRPRRISTLMLRMLLGFAVIFAGFLLYEQTRASAWCIWCLLLSSLFVIAVGFE
ncbi:MAG: vitamin K epoxide reductase family protein, partial [Akkermansiaceae bacterium]|nr:vitamin K epoxide reductase family protein [Akkermansiaceae bacterium]